MWVSSHTGNSKTNKKKLKKRKKKDKILRECFSVQGVFFLAERHFLIYMGEKNQSSEK